MTEKQEIKVKSMELAIGLLGVLTSPKTTSLNVDDAIRTVGDVVKLAGAFEAVILKASPD